MPKIELLLPIKIF